MRYYYGCRPGCVHFERDERTSASGMKGKLFFKSGYSDTADYDTVTCKTRVQRRNSRSKKVGFSQSECRQMLYTLPSRSNRSDLSQRRTTVFMVSALIHTIPVSRFCCAAVLMIAKHLIQRGHNFADGSIQIHKSSSSSSVT